MPDQFHQIHALLEGTLGQIGICGLGFAFHMELEGDVFLCSKVHGFLQKQVGTVPDR